MYNSDKIGVFDSCFSGLTIFRRIWERIAQAIARGLTNFAERYKYQLGGK